MALNIYTFKPRDVLKRRFCAEYVKLATIHELNLTMKETVEGGNHIPKLWYRYCTFGGEVYRKSNFSLWRHMKYDFQHIRRATVEKVPPYVE